MQWLVADQLGTPRMVLDRTGGLAGMRRHDYFPFGEEIQVGTGGRTTQQGYGQPNTLREWWATYERDDETELDYAQARYYSNVQGRFTSPDEFAGGPVELFYFVDDAAANPTFYADLTNPQPLNKYQYTYNNPLRYNDPTGHCPALPWLCPVIPVLPAVPRIVERAGPYVAAAAAAAAAAIVATGNNNTADPSCPACSNWNNAYQKRLEQKEANRLNIRNQDNSGNQHNNGAPPAQNSSQSSAGGADPGGRRGQGGDRPNLRIVSRIGESPKLVREAQSAGASAQRDLDSLTARLAQGNMNPGINNRFLFNGIYEARARGGGRVYFRRVGDTIEILAKSTKANQGAVISTLKKLYGN